MKNPYWHQYEKPHVIDFDEIRDLCIDAYLIVSSSNALSGQEEEDVSNSLNRYFFRVAEERLSASLLDIAIRMRVFDDILSSGDDEKVYKKIISDSDGIGNLIWKDKDGDKNVDLEFREACNKIIHACDVRPVYDNDGNSRDENFAWGMTGMVELSGKQGKREWDVCLNVDEFLTVCIDIANHFLPLSDD